MSMGAQDRDKVIRIGVISGAVLIVAIYGYVQLRTPDATPPVAPPRIIQSAPGTPISSAPAKTPSPVIVPSSPGAVPKSAQDTSATKVGTTASQYDPTLKMEAMLVSESLVYSGTGRNIFSDTSSPAMAAVPKPIAPVRTQQASQTPVYTGPPVPPPPPPIDLKFFGTATLANGTREAFLLHGEDVFLASTGSIVQRRYKIGPIAANSVEVEDMTNNNKQSLPLQKN